MIETVIFCAALLLVFLAGQIGMKAGAFPALSKMLAAVLALLITMRCWFFITRPACALGSASLLAVALLVFWAISLAVFYTILKLCDAHLDTFESVQPSLFGRALGAVFGCVGGAVVATALMMTLSLSAPVVWQSYQPAALPLPVDAAPELFFRMVETQVGGVKADDPAHTLLPKLENAGSPDPSAFWK